MENNELSELGLTKNEGKAYNILLERGKLSAGEISKFGAVPYSRVYEILASLEQKGLVKIIPEKTKKFVPLNPIELMEIIKKREKNLDKIKNKIKDMEKLYKKKSKRPVILGYGRKAFYKTLKEMKEPEKYNYSIKWTSEYKPDWIGKNKARIKKGIDVKTLARYDKKTEKDIKKWLRTNKKIKKFKNEGVAVDIVDDQEVLISLINSNLTLLVRDKAFAKIMKQLFRESYKNSKKIR